MENKKYLLSFKGSKQELHNQFKKICKEQGASMNTTILELIKKYLKK